MKTSSLLTIVFAMLWNFNYAQKKVAIDTTAEIKTTLDYIKKSIETYGDKDVLTTKGNSIEFELVGYGDKAECSAYKGSYIFEYDLEKKIITLKHIYSYECLTYKTDSVYHRFEKEETYKIPFTDLGKITANGNDLTITTKNYTPSISVYHKKTGGITKKGRFQNQNANNTNLSKDFKILNISQKDPKTVGDIVNKFNYLFTLIK